MSNERLSTLLENVRDWKESEPINLTVEQAGMLNAFLRSRQSVDGINELEKALLAKVAKAVNSWKATYREQHIRDSANKEKRRQLFLRTAVDKLKKKNYDELTDDELDTVRGSLESVSDCSNQGPSSVRLKKILTKLLSEYENFLEQKKLCGNPDEAESAQENTENTEDAEDTTPLPEHNIDAEKYFEGGTKTTVKTLAEIRVDLITRVFELTGNVNITGDIPDDVLLVVLKGEASVDGNIFGNLLAKRNIVVNGNIQGGWVISSMGNINVKRILTGTHLVSQMGGISCTSIEYPEIIFSRDKLEVTEDVRGGNLFAKDIMVKGTVTAAELHSVGIITAKAMKSSPNNPTILCLRQSLTCADYGRPVDPALIFLKRLMAKHTYHLAIISKIISYTEKDMHNCYRSMLYYLLGGLNKRTTVCLLRGAQYQLLYLDEIINTGKALSDYLHSLRVAGAKISVADIKMVAEECLRALRDIGFGIRSVPEEFGSTHKGTLIRTAKTLKRIADELINAAETSFKVGKVLEQLDSRIEEWFALLANAAAEADKYINEFGLDSAVVTQIENESEKLEQKLDDVLEASRKSPDIEKVERANSAFMRLMQRTVSLHKENCSVWERDLFAENAALTNVRSKLDKDPSILLWEPCNGISVHSEEYDIGVVLTTTPGVIKGTDTSEASVISLSRPIEEDTIFSFNGRTIRRESTRI